MRIILFITLIVLVVATVSQASDLSEKYDLNTEVQLEGEISDTIEQDSGPKIYVLQSNKRTYHLHAGPRWYLEESGLTLTKGDRVEVTGSKTYDKEGNLVLIIYDLKRSGNEKIYKFRDSNMRPLWRGRGAASAGRSGSAGGARGRAGSAGRSGSAGGARGGRR